MSPATERWRAADSFFGFAQTIVGVLFQQDDAQGNEHAEDDADGGADDRFQPDGARSGDGCGVEDLRVGVVGCEGDAGFGAFLQQKL